MSQAPRLHVAPRAAKTFGDLAGDLASDYGLTPDPWQRLVLDDWLAVDRLGAWTALTCGLSVPRQNGKNALLEIRELFGMVGRGEKILHTAHEVKTARKAFKRLQHFFGTKPDDPAAKFPELNALVAEVRNVNGQEAVVLKNGGSVEIVARSKNSARGFTVDVLVMDEAQEMTDDDLEALMPTTSSAPLGNPQWIYTGTPPGPRANGDVFTRTRNDALGKPKRLAWHEWSAPAASDLDDELSWRLANPALITGRLQFEVIEGERSRFSDEGFARERLGMWGEASTSQVIDAQTWAKCGDMTGQIVSEIALAVDVMPDRTAGSVSLAGKRDDDRWQVELVDNRNSVGWIVDRVAGICERQAVRAVIIDAQSPAASLIEALEARGVVVTKTGARDMAAACGQFYDAVMEDGLRHLDVPLLNSALGVARKRSLGDAWAWHRKNVVADITPLVSCTLALWGAQSESVTRTKKPSAAFAF